MKKIFLSLLIIPLLSFSIHKYYIALTEIEYKEDSNSVQMIMNVFIDDIEHSINKEYTIDAKLSYDDELKNIDLYFEKYLNTHFNISINNISREYKYIGKEYNGNIIYFYLEIDNVSSLKNIEINNTMLLEYFPEQQNLIKVKINKERKSLFLTQKTPKGLLKF